MKAELQAFPSMKLPADDSGGQNPKIDFHGPDISFCKAGNKISNAVNYKKSIHMQEFSL